MHIYIFPRNNIIEKRSHEFDGEQGRVYGRVWNEEREGENVIRIQYQNQKSRKVNFVFNV